jgi:CubicO group peptidase (beta-lactamase class C family)
MNIAPIRSAWIALMLLSPALAAGESPATLEGVWGATRHFGPEIRGPIEIVRSGDELRLRVAQYDVRLNNVRGALNSWLPAGQGRFEGWFEQNGTVIRGHWIQATTATDGSDFASPVTLRSATRDRWTGIVTPYDESFTFYVVFQNDAAGTRAFIRNPDRNQGLWWSVQRADRDGDRVKLVGKFRGRGDDRVFGEGTLRPDDGVLSMYFPGRGGAYDLRPIDGESSYYARPQRELAQGYAYRPPPATGDGWKMGTLVEVGLDPAPIEEFIRMAMAEPRSVEDLDLHGVLIARHGKLVLEEYFHGYHRAKPHDTRSAGKTLAAMLVGAQMQKGAKISPATRVYDLLPGVETDERKRGMTVAHLLTMSSGYDCDDWDGSRPGSEDKILDERPDDDYYRYTLRLPMEMAPGTQAVYCSINPNLVGAVLREATGRSVLRLFDETIARPLQFDRYYIGLQPTGEAYLGGGARLLPRDFMKFGQVMLDGGTWNGVRILPREYAKSAGSPLVTLRNQPAGMRYGYTWWTIDYPYQGRTITAYFASGNGGQVVVVVPEADMVIACFGGNYGGRAGWAVVREHIPKYILGAVKK